MSTAFLHSPDFQRYDLGEGHPFKAVRGEATRSLLEHVGLLSPGALVRPEPAMLEDLLAVHSRGYLERVIAASRGEPVRDALEYGLGTSDTPMFLGMHEATAVVAGGTLTAARFVVDGTHTRALNLSGGLHHAHRDRGAGFCVYNDLSVAIADLRTRGLRVAYLDVDAHHGDGVQWLHYEDPDVLTLSLHETGRYLYPGTGFTYELGRGAGLGTSLNVPLEPFTEDDSFLEALERVLAPALEWFRPDVLLLQGGADAHAEDPLAHLALTVGGFERAFRLIVELTETYAGGRIIATGGGGYAVWTVVPRVWGALYAALEGRTLPREVPAAWLETWQPFSPDPLPPTMADPKFVIPRRAEIEARNARTVDRLLEDWNRVVKAK